MKETQKSTPKTNIDISKLTVIFININLNMLNVTLFELTKTSVSVLTFLLIFHLIIYVCLSSKDLHFLVSYPHSFSFCIICTAVLS